MRKTRASATALGLVLFAAIPRQGHAQSVRGQVVDSVSGSGVPAGFVVLLNRDRAEVARALADGDGRFVVVAPRAGTYRLRSERIGFRALTSEPFTLQPDSALDYRLMVSALPVRLSDLAVTGETPCRALGEQQAAVAVWEEARKALAAVVWGQQGRLLFDLRLHERMLSPQFEVRSEDVRLTSGMGNRPFTTRSPAELGTGGYTKPLADGGKVFYGPDAEILFSNDFLSQHCFHVVAPSGAQGMIGLAFEPVRSRRLADIAGTIWLDDASAELKFVEYWYVNHGLAGVDREATGRVDFERLTEGYWMVRRWRIRLPVVEALRDNASMDRRSVTTGATRLRIASFVEDGGDVLRASTGGIVIASRAAASTVTGRVTDGASRPIAGVVVRLEGTSYQAISSASGEVQLTGVAEGVYTVKYIHPMVPGLGPVAAPGLIVSAEAGRDTTFSMVLPEVVALLDQTCPARNAVEHHSALAGGVRRLPTLAPVTGFRVRVTWPQWTVSTVGGRAVATNRWESVETESTGTGHYLACDLPPEREATLYALSGPAEQVIATLKVMPDTIHQRNVGVRGDSVFVR